MSTLLVSAQIYECVTVTNDAFPRSILKQFLNLSKRLKDWYTENVSASACCQYSFKVGWHLDVGKFIEPASDCNWQETQNSGVVVLPEVAAEIIKTIAPPVQSEEGGNNDK